MKNRFIVFVLIILAIIAGGVYYGFTGDKKDALENVDEIPQVGNAVVDKVDVLVLESFPLQVIANVSGNVPDSCTSVFEKEIVLVNDTFYVVLNNERDPEMVCAQVITPYEKSISLDVYNFKAGEYKVNVNQVESSFTLSQDNSL